jgi:hypothetical protein
MGELRTLLRRAMTDCIGKDARGHVDGDCAEIAAFADGPFESHLRPDSTSAAPQLATCLLPRSIVKAGVVETYPWLRSK